MPLAVGTRLGPYEIVSAIYGFEEANGIQALALELVDGPTLADRMKC